MKGNKPKPITNEKILAKCNIGLVVILQTGIKLIVWTMEFDQMNRRSEKRYMTINTNQDL